MATITELLIKIWHDKVRNEGIPAHNEEGSRKGLPRNILEYECFDGNKLLPVLYMLMMFLLLGARKEPEGIPTLNGWG